MKMVHTFLESYQDKAGIVVLPSWRIHVASIKIIQLNNQITIVADCISGPGDFFFLLLQRKKITS